MEKFLEGYRRFRETYFRENESFIGDLMAQPQTPRALMIACSDSRIDPSLKFGVAPGEMFVIRNVANLVPPFEPDGAYHGTSAALEFAVRTLDVPDIIVMGHARCGGIHALMHQPKGEDFIVSWMMIAKDARDHALAAKLAPEATQRLCEQEAVRVSLRNLMTFPWVKERVEAKTLRIHGWYFDLATGTLHTLSANDTFDPV